MAKFCSECGKPLEEGKSCCCSASETVHFQQILEQEVEEYPNIGIHRENQRNQRDSQFTQINHSLLLSKDEKDSYFYDIMCTFKHILYAPVTHGVEFVKSKDTSTGLKLIGLQALLSGVFACIVSSKLNTVLSTHNNTFSLLSKKIDIKMPMMNIFIVTIIFSCILSLALAGILYVISHFVQNKVTFDSMVCTCGVRSVPIIVVNLITIALFYINNFYGILLFFLGNLIGYFYLIQVYPCTSESKEKVPLILFLSAMVFIVVTYMIMYRGIDVYIPEELKAKWAYIKDDISNVEVIFDNFMGRFF